MSRCTDTNKLSAAGPDAQARSILSPQPPSVRSGVLSLFDSARAGVVPGWAGPNVSGPSAARAGTGTRLAGAVAHEWPSVPTVVGAGSSSQHHPQSPVPIGPDVQAPLDSGHGRPFAGLCVFYRNAATFRLATDFAEGTSKKKKQSKQFHNNSSV